MKKTTAIAPANIALIKFWGKKDENLRLPANGSISINLSGLLTTTTVEFDSKLKQDQIEINHLPENQPNNRISKHLDRVRKLAGINVSAKVVSENNFPISSGLSSSSSGFAALTMAAIRAAGLNLSVKELSILSRFGSGSACRSIPDGFVEWLEGDKTSDSSYAYSLHSPDYWDLAIVVVLAGKEKKQVLSSDGHKLVWTSPFFKTRLKNIKEKISKIKTYLKNKDFNQFGKLLEVEALELHAMMLTSTPPLVYWSPKTIEIIKMVQRVRSEGLPVYFTIDAGPHLHLICEKKNLPLLLKKISYISSKEEIVINYPSLGARLVDKHLF